MTENMKLQTEIKYKLETINRQSEKEHNQTGRGKQTEKQTENQELNRQNVTETKHNQETVNRQ